MVYEILDSKKISPLFGHWEETFIWSCLQGIMGKLYANSLIQPTAAMAILGDFAFFAGRPTTELLSYQSAWHLKSFMIMVPQNKDWLNLIVHYYGNKATVTSRYATKKEAHCFNIPKLEQVIASLSSEYTLSMINEPLYYLCKAETWSADLVSQFPTYEAYHKLGLGAVILKNKELVSGASSYSRYKEGIEIEIDTRDDYRRKGLASVCGAKLILECLKRNLYPSWDAHNKSSLALAEKLGYHYSHTYTAVEIWEL